MACLTFKSQLLMVGKQSGRQWLTALWNHPSDAQGQQIFVEDFMSKYGHHKAFLRFLRIGIIYLKVCTSFSSTFSSKQVPFWHFIGLSMG